MNLLQVRCCIKQNKQYFDLSQVEFIEVLDTEYCAGWIPNVGKYRELNISFKTGNILNVTVEEQVVEAIFIHYEGLNNG